MDMTDDELNAKNDLMARAIAILMSDEAALEQVYAMMAELDARAAEKGEPDGLRIRYGVGMKSNALAVFRGADERHLDDIDLPEGYAEIYCVVPPEIAIEDEWLGPVFIPRPEPEVTVDVDMSNTRPVELKGDEGMQLLICERQLNLSLDRIFPTKTIGDTTVTIIDPDAPDGQTFDEAFSAYADLTDAASGPSPP